MAMATGVYGVSSLLALASDVNVPGNLQAGWYDLVIYHYVHVYYMNVFGCGYSLSLSVGSCAYSRWRDSIGHFVPSEGTVKGKGNWLKVGIGHGGECTGLNTEWFHIVI